MEAVDRDFLASIGATLVPLYTDNAPTEGYVDGPDGYLRHMREHAHVAAVIRPDFYLFGAATHAPGLRELLRQLREPTAQLQAALRHQCRAATMAPYDAARIHARSVWHRTPS